MKKFLAKIKYFLSKYNKLTYFVVICVALFIQSIFIIDCGDGYSHIREPTTARAESPSYSFDLEDIGADLLVSNNLAFINGDGTNYFISLSYVFSQGSEDYILDVGEVPDNVGESLNLTLRGWYAVQWNNIPLTVPFKCTCLEYVKGDVYNLTDFAPEVVYTLASPPYDGFEVYIYINNDTYTHLVFQPLDGWYVDTILSRGVPSFSYILDDDFTYTISQEIENAYNTGYRDGESATFNPLGGIISSVDAFLKIELLPNVPISYVLTLVIGLCLVRILLKLV